MDARILVAEDDRKQADLICRYLEREGYSVAVVHDGRAAIEAARHRRPDLLVLDVMMPRVDGLDVCRVLRAESDVPIIMLTARSTEDDMLLGLDLGADDYLTKPYSPRELVARVRTVLRRTRKAGNANGGGEGPYRVGDLEVDPVRHEVRLNGATVETTPAEFRILAALIAEPGRAFSRAQLLTEAFGFDHYALDRTVDVHVMNLRRKIEEKASEPRYLLTVYGVGYKMADEA
ncbi:MAG: response regulator transcription factor [Actinomycetota bacterium]